MIPQLNNNPVKLKALYKKRIDAKLILSITEATRFT